MKYLIVHHTGGTDADPMLDTSHHTFDIVNEYHRQKWDFKSRLNFYIAYHYFIEKDGRTIQGRMDAELGAHTKGYNNSIGICLAGNFDATDPTKEQEKSLKELLARLVAKYTIEYKNIVPHRKFARKSCYGNRLSDNWARDLVMGNLEGELVKVKGQPEIYLIEDGKRRHIENEPTYFLYTGKQLRSDEWHEFNEEDLVHYSKGEPITFEDQPNKLKRAVRFAALNPAYVRNVLRL